MNPGKKYIVFFLIVVVFIQSMSLPLMYFNFKANRDYIATNLCVNRDKPITICGGLCYLGKQFNENQKDQESGKTASVKKLQVESLCEENFISAPLNISITDKTYDKPYQNFYQSICCFDIFHPPIA